MRAQTALVPSLYKGTKPSSSAVFGPHSSSLDSESLSASLEEEPDFLSLVK